MDPDIFADILLSRLENLTGGGNQVIINIYIDNDVLRRLHMTRTYKHFSDHGIGRDTLDAGKQALTRGSSAVVEGNFDHWCREKISANHVLEEVNASNLILILRDSDTKQRGFALLDVGVSSMELLVLCCAPLPTAPLPNKVYARGKSLIQYIQYLGHRLRWGIGLYALPPVISLYYHFGWRPRHSCEAIQRYDMKRLIDMLRKHYQDNPDDDDLPTHLRPRFRRYLRGRTRLLLEGKTSAEADEDAEMDGIRMWLCRDQNPYAPPPADPITGSPRALPPPRPGVFVKGKRLRGPGA